MFTVNPFNLPIVDETTTKHDTSASVPCVVPFPHGWQSSRLKN